MYLTLCTGAFVGEDASCLDRSHALLRCVLPQSSDGGVLCDPCKNAELSSFTEGSFFQLSFFQLFERASAPLHDVPTSKL